MLELSLVYQILPLKSTPKMIVACHVLVGAAIAQSAQNPALGLFFAFLSHFILDFIPHEEYPINKAEKLWKIRYTEFIKVATDIFAGFFLVFIFADNLIVALAGGFFGIIPDLLSASFFVFPQNIFVRNFYYFHTKKVHFLKNKFSLLGKILTQLAVFLIALYLLSN